MIKRNLILKDLMQILHVVLDSDLAETIENFFVDLKLFAYDFVLLIYWMKDYFAVVKMVHDFEHEKKVGISNTKM